MFIRKPHPLEPVGGTETPESVFRQRRRFLRMAGIAAGIGVAGSGMYAAWRIYRGSDDEVILRGAADGETRRRVAHLYPATGDDRFEYGRPETLEAAAARYTNFYEFSRLKWSWRLVDRFQTDPWTITVDGLCRNPLRLDVGDLLERYAPALVERQYRHRCVERWAMAVPWTGIPLARVLADADPLASARYVRFVSFHRPAEAPGVAAMPAAPWPYVEGLTLSEATCELTLLATGMYGHPLLKQHGAPIRLVVPWKYGYKSIKSIERIELVDRRPATFWNTLDPISYPFESNVEPDVPRPWPQNTEQMLGTGERYATQPFNGYASYVATMYDA
jgi:methionine sulfoxide reductase catalytic subunit